jgi:hypothetical protein
MTQLYPTLSINHNKATCDICHFAKEKKLPFNITNSIAKSKFELVHFDI